MYTGLSFHLVFGKVFLSGFKYRDRSSIIKDIIESINSDPRGKTKTSIMRCANLNYEQVNTYLRYLLLKGLIKPVDPVNSQEVARYKMTLRGTELARDIEAWSFVLTSYQRRTI